VLETSSHQHHHLLVTICRLGNSLGCWIRNTGNGSLPTLGELMEIHVVARGLERGRFFIHLHGERRLCCSINSMGDGELTKWASAVVIILLLEEDEKFARREVGGSFFGEREGAPSVESTEQQFLDATNIKSVQNFLCSHSPAGPIRASQTWEFNGSYPTAHLLPLSRRQNVKQNTLPLLSTHPIYLV
jgi:hypothetical protein